MESESRLQEDNMANDFDPDDQKDKNTRTKDILKTSHSNKRTISPLTLFKEDFNQFKEDVTSIFSINTSKDKETKSLEPKTSQSTEKTVNPLSLLKEDFSHFRDDLSNVFRIGLSKDKNNKDITVKEESSNTFKIKVQEAETTEGPIQGLSRRDQNNHKDKKTEGQIEEGFRENVSEQNGETSETINHNWKDEIHEVPSSQEAEQRGEEDEWSDDSSVVSAEDERTNDEEASKPSETLPFVSLSSEISLFSLRDSHHDNKRDRTEDLWSVKKFACYLTFDPNTANSELHLTDGNRKATRVWSGHRPTDHPDRFEHCPQLLCREGLLDSVYWEVLWSGGADIGVTYNSISRDGDTSSSLLGYNAGSWSLECSEGCYTPCHNNKRFRSSSPQPFSHRVGVYLNWSAGSLSFYCISQDTMVHLHTFTSDFTEPLYPGFWVWAYDSSVSLCQVELDWERLLQ